MRFLVKSLVNSSPRQENVFAFELHYCVICCSLHEVRSLEVSALVVLLAVLAVVEGLHHLGVLLGGKHLKGLGHFLAVAKVLGEASDLTVDPLDALLGLEDGHVNVLNSLDHVGGRFIIFSHHISLFTSSINSHKGGEEEGEAEQGQDGDQDRGQVKTSAGLLIPIAGGGVRGLGGAIRGLGSAIGRLGRPVRGGGGGVSWLRGAI